MSLRVALLAVGGLAAFTSALWAQAPRPRAAAPPATANQVVQPDNTTATYGDWTHRCQQGVGTRVCEIVQTLRVQGQQEPVALIALGRPVGTEPYRLAAQLPVNVTLAAGVTLALGESDEGLPAGFQRCMAGGCFADVAMTDEALKRWRAFSGNGQMRYQDAARRDVSLPFSFRGFPAAVDALMKN